MEYDGRFKGVYIHNGSLRFNGFKFTSDEVACFRVSVLNYLIPVALIAVVIAWHFWGSVGVTFINGLVTALLLTVAVAVTTELLRPNGTRLLVLKPKRQKPNYAYVKATEAVRVVAFWAELTSFEQFEREYNKSKAGSN